mgnify:FL=1
MLVPAQGDCAICGESLFGEMVQDTECTCKSCKNVVQACPRCRQLPCLECGGQVQSASDQASKDGWVF